MFDKKQVFDAITIEKCIYAEDSDTFGIYVGFQEISGVIGPTKIGRTINVKALQRGRSQGGANWWFYAFWSLANKQETYELKKIIKKKLNKYKFEGEQKQQELYSIPPHVATSHIADIIGTQPTLSSLWGKYDTDRNI